MRRLLSLLTLVTLQTQAATLTLPETFTAVTVNDIEQPSHFFAKKTVLELAKGDHTIVIEYKDLFDGDDDHTTVRSKPIVLLFSLNEQEAANAKLSIKTLPLIEVEDAKAFVKKPKMTIVDQHNIEIVSVVESLTAFNSRRAFNAFEQTKASGRAKSRAVINKPISSCDVSNEQISLAQLKCVWSKSSKTDQEAFVHFILAQQYGVK